MRLSLCLLIAISISACSGQPQKNERVTDNRAYNESKDVAASADATFFTEVTFDRGNTKLAAMDREKINTMLETARDFGKIEDVKIVTWADQEYPSTQAKHLAKDQIKLADARTREIEHAVHSSSAQQAKAIDVDTYNMAKRPNSLAKLVGTDDARVKRNLEAAGIPTSASVTNFPSKASKALVMVIMEK